VQPAVVSLSVRDRHADRDGEPYLSNPPDVFSAIFLAESQILVQSEAHIIPIETVGSQSKVEQVLLQCNGYGRFAACRETGKPESEACLAAEGAPLGVGDRGVVPCYVAEGVLILLDSMERKRGVHTYVAIEGSVCCVV